MVAKYLVEQGEVFIDSELLQHFQSNKEINDYFFYFEKNLKASMKRFYENAENMMKKFLPSDLVRNLKNILSDMSRVLEGEVFKESDIVCLRQLQLLHHLETE